MSRVERWPQKHFFSAGWQPHARDIYYSVQEGVLFHIKQCFEELCHLVGKPEMIMVSGGIVNSNRWMQLLADILNCPYMRMEYPSFSVRGGSAGAQGHGTCPDMAGPKSAKNFLSP